jgi:hypothetical protein
VNGLIWQNLLRKAVAQKGFFFAIDDDIGTDIFLSAKKAKKKKIKQFILKKKIF